MTKKIRFLNSPSQVKSDSSNEFCHHILILRKFAYGKKIRIWKNNSPMEKQFDYGKTIRLWKNNSIMEQNSILKTNQFGNQIYIFNFEFFFYFFRFKELGGRNSTDSGSNFDFENKFQF